eukprot:364268-Chlamydomonas_euryale.AAC.6
MQRRIANLRPESGVAHSRGGGSRLTIPAAAAAAAAAAFCVARMHGTHMYRLILGCMALPTPPVRLPACPCKARGAGQRRHCERVVRQPHGRNMERRRRGGDYAERDRGGGGGPVADGESVQGHWMRWLCDMRPPPPFGARW